MVLSLLSSISKDLASSMVYAATACEDWMDLKDHFTQSISGLIHVIGCQIYKAKGMLERACFLWLSLNLLLRSLKEIADKDQKVRVIQFLLSLNDIYNTLRGHIPILGPLPFVTKLWSLVLQEERQREAGMQPASNDCVSLTTSAENKFQKKKTGWKPTYFCTHCNMSGHPTFLQA